MYSPLQMAADLPENYEKRMDAFQFIKDVAVDWDDTKVIDAEPGDFIIMARRAKASSNWYLGAITDEQARNFTTPLDFLSSGRNYVATIYRLTLAVFAPCGTLVDCCEPTCPPL